MYIKFYSLLNTNIYFTIVKTKRLIHTSYLELNEIHLIDGKLGV